MKRYLLILLVSSMVLMLCACGSFKVTGIENYRKETCSVGLTAHMFPSDDFLTKFEYESGDYGYCDSGDFAWGYVTTFCQLLYEDGIYTKAKEYCLSKFAVCVTHQYEYEGYLFYETISHEETDMNGTANSACRYPKQFNMFAYCDEKNTLIFLGYYNGNPNDTEKELAESNFGLFLKTAFGTGSRTGDVFRTGDGSLS